ncbi:MAG: AraC family transcriptional regulator [Clostridiales bacterium]|nr:AraC family transcriptional regulator [Clostridiales bacterium]
MKSKLRENLQRGTKLFPFQHYRCQDSNGHIFIPYHWHPETEIIYCMTGCIQLLLDGVEYTLKPGDICFANSGQLHQITSDTVGTIYYSYVFPLNSLDFLLSDDSQNLCLDPLKKNRRFPEQLPKTCSCYRQIRAEILEIISINEKQFTGFQLQTKAALYKIISHLYRENLFLSRNTKETPLSSKSEDIRSLLIYLQDHFSEKIYLEDAATLLHMSPKYFCTYFKSTFGTGFIEYLNHLRIEHACLLLTTSDLSIMEIGFECGFENFSYFIKQFKKLTGQTPRSYRHSNF